MVVKLEKDGIEENLYQRACRLFPHKEGWNRQATHVMRAKWIRAVMMLGDKWVYHKSHYAQRKTT